VVGIVGPRQAGKSTLAQRMIAMADAASYVSLDDLSVRTTAEADPQGFVSGRPGLLVIDEVQRVPELLLAIKAEVDRDQRPGRFLITGSTQLSAARGVSETLAGRIERFELWPLSRSEVAGRSGALVDHLLDGDIPRGYRSSASKLDYLELALAGGFPEALRRNDRRRSAWFDAYVETVIEREAPGVSASPRTADLPRLVRLVAARHASVLNVAELARAAGMPESSVHRYLEILEAVFLVRRVPPWATNRSKRETRAAKVFITDPGLASHLRDADISTLSRPELALGADGPLVEGLVFAEVLRQSGWSAYRQRLMHYRERDLVEVDLLVEDNRGRMVAIEVKAAIDIAPRDFRHLGTLRDRVGERFSAGVLLHCGRDVSPLGDRLWAMPISALWEAG
jgi:predicted AAA+ superfamily ATPase